MKEGNAFEGLVTLSLLLVFGLVIVTGILSFVRLNSIIFTVNEGIRPNPAINDIKDIFSDLLLADNYVKSYSLSRKEEDMANYDTLVMNTREKMADLRENLAEDPVLTSYMDTLDILVEEKFDILDMLMIYSNEYPMEEAIDKVRMEIEISDIRSRYGQNPDSSVTGGLSPTEFSIDQISQWLKKAQTEALSEKRINQQDQLEQIRRDKLIMNWLRRIISNLEERQVATIRHHTNIAKSEAFEVKRILLTFGLATFLFLILTGTVIFLYVRRNNQYRRILKAARNDAEELATARQQFLANMSHEIKTPMNVISGYLDQILKSPLKKEQREHLGIVRKSTDHLLKLLNDLLDLARLQANKMDLAESVFQPAELVRDIYDWLMPMASEKHLKVIMDPDPALPEWVSGDNVRLRQILFNLASNAVKFTEEGTVMLRAYPGSDIPGKVSIVFEVSDSGIGISSQDLEKIFTEFGQGGDRTGKRSEGTGLGLTITKMLVDRMGGTISVESAPGKGSVFRAEIPFILAEKPGTSEQVKQMPSTEILEGKKVLLVDDEEYNRSLLKLILGKYNCEVIEAENGEEAVEKANREIPDLVLIDIRMPGLSGPEAAAEIRRTTGERGKDISIIALSAGASPADIAEYHDQGIDEFIAKPFEEEQLIRVVINLLNGNGDLDATDSPSEEPAAMDTEELMPAAEDGFDLEPLKEASAGNSEFYTEMIHMFLDHTDKGLKELEKLVSSGSWKKVAETAHKMSAPCRHLKAEKLYRLLKLIEKESTTERVKVGQLLVQEASEEFERIRAGILARIGQSK